jgi:hypothetical protein
MAQTNYTPISLYYSTTAAALPTAGNLVSGELAINITDEKLYFKNAAGVVKLLASNAITTPVTTISFGSTGLTPSTATSGAVTVAGTLAILNGGTGNTTAGAAFNALSPITTTGDLILGNGTNSATRLGIGLNGYVLTSNGTTASWAASSGGVSTFSAGTTGLTPATATSGAVTLAGILAVANGGTGTATPAIVAGTNITVSGTWPNQTINSTASGSGTVTSVAATVPSFLSIAGSPITTSGTLAITLSGTALPVANGGTGLTSGTSGGVLAYTATGTLVSSGELTQYGVVIGGGAGVAPTSTAAGTSTTVLHGNASGTPTFGAVSLTADVSGTLPNTSGGTGQSGAFTQYGVTYASTTSALATTAAGTAGYVLTANSGSAPTFQAPSSSGATKGQAIAFSIVFGL